MKKIFKTSYRTLTGTTAQPRQKGTSGFMWINFKFKRLI